MSVSSSQPPQSRLMADDSPQTILDNAKVSTSLKREQILQGATRVFLQHGYVGTSMDRVAIEAGVSKQTIYSHFKDKNGLFTALVERVTSRQFQVALDSEPFQGEPTLILHRIAYEYLAKMEDPGFIDLLRVVVAESARFPELAELYTKTVIQPPCYSLSQYFKSHPELNIPDPEALAQIFFGSLSAFILSQQILGGKSIMPIESERLVNSLVALCNIRLPSAKLTLKDA